MTETILKGLSLFIGEIILLFIGVLLLSLPTYWLWNWLMPVIFGINKITWLQALGVNILTTFLFKGVSKSS